MTVFAETRIITKFQQNARKNEIFSLFIIHRLLQKYCFAISVKVHLNITRGSAGLKSVLGINSHIRAKAY